ncbi:MAG: hypothetical protein M3Q55_09140 [Acidobacteriota bacterium]|nr:hypothetical protein [Acidobacteriota bacterium]
MPNRESFAETQIPTTGRAGIPYPDYHKIVQGLLLHGAEMFFGTMTGTGAALDSPALPFDPAMVMIINQTTLCKGIKLPSMADDDFYKEVAAGTATYDTAGGITLGVKKFTLGTDVELNAAANVIHFVAFGAKSVGGS